MAKASNTKTAAKKATPATAPTSSPQAKNTTEPALLDFFKDELKDIYWAENHLVKSLPKMIKAATSGSLAKAFADHLEVTQTHVTRLEQVFELLGEKPKAKKCDAMEGLSKEAEGIIEDTDSGTATRDVGLIMAAQKVEHYEIATYGGLARLAETLGLTEVKNLLGQTLDEEKESDEILTNIAESKVNEQAASE
jgi:ferritin-like metal-binding protein YciE